MVNNQLFVIINISKHNPILQSQKIKKNEGL